VAWAQAPLPPNTLPGEKPLPVPEFRQPAPEVTPLPPLAPPEAGRLPFMPRVVVRKFRITGSTVFSEAELAKIAAPFENREITSTELEELRRQLTLYYVSRGYVNSGAVLPDQRIDSGVVEIRIIEGRLSGIEVTGTRNFRPEYFTNRLELRAGPPLNLVNLEQGLQILLGNPLVSSINAELAPGERPGEAVLKARVTEAPRADFGVSLDNKLSPSLGEEALIFFGEVRNLTGWGDTLSGSFRFAQGIPYDVDLRYRTPLNRHDTAATLYYDKAKSKVVQEPFDVLDITSEIETVGFQLSHPLYFTPNRRLELGAALEHRETRTTLLGEPFSFSPGVDNGKATVSVLRLIQDFVDRGREQVFAARSTFSFGFNAFGATVHDDAPDGQFAAWLGQAQWVRRLTERGDQLLLRLNGQWTNDSLLPLEQFTVGGLDSVRGYRTNQLVRDRGYTATVEYRRPLFADPQGWQNLQLALFADNGGAQNKVGPNPAPSHLTGIGAGLIWNPSKRLFAEIYVASGRSHLPDQPGHSLQDDGIYFRFTAFPFRSD